MSFSSLFPQYLTTAMLTGAVHVTILYILWSYLWCLLLSGIKTTAPWSEWIRGYSADPVLWRGRCAALLALCLVSE